MSSSCHEEDYQRRFQHVQTTRWLDHSSVELVRPRALAKKPQHVLFDFDGTLSLIREGWPQVMVPMMVEVLEECGTGESPDALEKLVFEFVMQLNGKQTVYQMIRLAEEVRQRGGQPKDPLLYKQVYHDRLMQRIEGRREALRSGTVQPEAMLVPYSFDILRALQARDAQLYIASGTDQQYVIEEVQLLGLAPYFGHHVYGAQDDYRTFSKAMVIDRILKENKIQGELLVGFGDGYVEIQNIKAVGGTAVAVASDEANRSGKPDAWKRDRLIGVGADLVIPDYCDWNVLVNYLWNEA